MVIPVLMLPSSEDHPDRAAVPAARILFEIFNRLRRGLLGRSDDGHSPHMREERVERIEAGGKRSFDVIDGCETGPRTIRSRRRR